jgi:hypothetical protein
MLTFCSINNIEYYKNTVQDDYNISEESLGIWHGKQEKHLKFSENVNITDFDNLLNSNQNIKRGRLVEGGK